MHSGDNKHQIQYLFPAPDDRTRATVHATFNASDFSDITNLTDKICIDLFKQLASSNRSDSINSSDISDTSDTSDSSTAAANSNSPNPAAAENDE